MKAGEPTACRADALVIDALDAGRRDKLEKLRVGYVDVEQWLRWRDVLNRLAHEYPEAPELRHAAMLAAIASASELMACYQAWKLRVTKA